MKTLFTDRISFLVSGTLLSLAFLSCSPVPNRSGNANIPSPRTFDLVVHAAEPVPAQDPVTIELTRTDAESGGVDAQFELGQWYYHGTYVAQDYKEAYEWFLKAAQKRHTQAMVYVGDMNVQGLGVAQNYAEAIGWYKKADRKDSPQAQFQLGLMYEKGQGVNSSEAQALKWFRKAAAQNFAEAQFHLGSIYEKGAGVAQDYVQAYQWFRQALGNGHPEAAQAMSSLTPRMSADQLAQLP